MIENCRDNQVWQNRSKQLREALTELTGQLTTSGGERDIYVFGSFVRILAISGQNSLEGYFQTASFRKELQPRINFRGNCDVDIGVPTGQIQWLEIAGVAGTVTHKWPGIEIDPHLMEGNLREGFLIKYATEIGGVKRKKELFFRFEFTSMVVKDDLIPLKPLTPSGQLEYLTYYLPRYRDIPETANLLAYLTGMPAWQCYPRAVGEMSRFFGYVDWNSLSKVEAIRLCYRVLIPLSIRRIVAKMRGKNDKGTFNYQSPEPVFF